ncbi:MAG: hypothetical protein KZQ96_22140 [Candidatus Thiodiazotropha sp. (ex Lucinoma borealis)]|nr:hypothetical protein [Candidatus Thiodiazotropha sp. (ex Lucinoma borealis)]
MKYKKGQSGNPKGRPKGIVDRRSLFRKHIESNAENLVKKVVAMALEGDVRAMKLCLERISPPMKPRDEPIQIEDLKGTLTEQGQKILSSMGKSQLTPSEAAVMLSALVSLIRIKEATDLENRIANLEDNRSN